MKAPSRRTQALVLVAFLILQGLDALTTHIGFGHSHPELNQVMATVIGAHGELAAYAVKGLAVAVLLAMLMILQHRRPRVWHAFQVAAGLTAAAVTVNLIQILG